MVEHVLKIWPSWFEAVATGRKCFEVRRDDRGFATGDVLRLRCYDPGKGAYTGQEVRARVDYIAFAQFGQPPGLDHGFCVMSISVIDPLEAIRVDQADLETLARAETHALDTIAAAQRRIESAVSLARDIRRETFLRGLKSRRRRKVQSWTP